MNNLTPELEVMFGDLKDILTHASRHQGEVSPIYVRDKIAELEAEVEDALTPKCEGCGEPFDSGIQAELRLGYHKPICADCYKNQQQKASRLCPQCGCLFVPEAMSEQLECPDCIADLEAHREEVERAHAATNGTL